MDYRGALLRTIRKPAENSHAIQPEAPVTLPAPHIDETPNPRKNIGGTTYNNRTIHRLVF
jgi:hypothetical protein